MIDPVQLTIVPMPLLARGMVQARENSGFVDDASLTKIMEHGGGRRPERDDPGALEAIELGDEIFLHEAHQ